MSSGFQTPITIADAMYNIEKNAYVLPAFQRDFLWEAERIEKLFDSLMRNYPTSSMLLWKIEGDVKPAWRFYQFLDKYVENARNHQNINSPYNHVGTNDYYAVLDGQQRLTAIRIGLFGTYAYHERNKSKEYSENSFPTRRLYLRLLKNVGSEYQLEYIFSFLKDSETNQADLIKDKEDNLWFKVSALYAIHDSEGGIDDFCDDNELNKEQKTILRRLNRCVFEDKHINYYLEDNKSPDRAVNIFNRINSGGVSLEFTDIIFSLIVAQWNGDAKNEFKNLIAQIEQKGFKIDKDYVIKAFLYLYHPNLKTEIGNFDIPFCKKIENNWCNIRDAIIALFELLKVFGLDEYKLTSANATLPILYYIYHQNIYSTISTSVKYSNERTNIKKWLLAMLVRRPFGAQTERVLAQSRKAFTEDIAVEFFDRPITEFPAVAILSQLKSLHDLNDDFFDDLFSLQKDNKYTFSILALLYPNLDYKNNNFHKDHLHPENCYKDLSDDLKRNFPFSVYNSVLNLQMLDSNENESKSDMPLKEWVDKSTDSTNRDSFLKNHLIPNVDLSLNNFEEFITKRKELLKEQLLALLS